MEIPSLLWEASSFFKALLKYPLFQKAQGIPTAREYSFLLHHNELTSAGMSTAQFQLLGFQVHYPFPSSPGIFPYICTCHTYPTCLRPTMPMLPLCQVGSQLPIQSSADPGAPPSRQSEFKYLSSFSHCCYSGSPYLSFLFSSLDHHKSHGVPMCSPNYQIHQPEHFNNKCLKALLISTTAQSQLSGSLPICALTSSSCLAITQGTRLLPLTSGTHCHLPCTCHSQSLECSSHKWFIFTHQLYTFNLSGHV